MYYDFLYKSKVKINLKKVYLNYLELLSELATTFSLNIWLLKNV